MYYTAIARSNDRLGDFEKLNATIPGRLDNFFEMPWCGEQLWRPATVDQIEEFFLNAAREISNELHTQRYSAIQEFKGHGAWKRAALRLSGWQAPHAPAVCELLVELTERCEALIKRLEWDMRRQFWRNSDLAAFAAKIEEVIGRMNPAQLAAAA